MFYPRSPFPPSLTPYFRLAPFVCQVFFSTSKLPFFFPSFPGAIQKNFTGFPRILCPLCFRRALYTYTTTAFESRDWTVFPKAVFCTCLLAFLLGFEPSPWLYVAKRLFLFHFTFPPSPMPGGVVSGRSWSKAAPTVGARGGPFPI